MSYRIFWGHFNDDIVVEGAGIDRAEVESLLGQARPQASWAEVFDEHGIAVAHQSAGTHGLAGFPGAHGWGHLCEACRLEIELRCRDGSRTQGGGQPAELGRSRVAKHEVLKRRAMAHAPDACRYSNCSAYAARSLA